MPKKTLGGHPNPNPPPFVQERLIVFDAFAAQHNSHNNMSRCLSALLSLSAYLVLLRIYLGDLINCIQL